jgi:hypothetical protein
MHVVRLQWYTRGGVKSGHVLATLEYQCKTLPKFEDEIEDVLGIVADALDLDAQGFAESKCWIDGKEQ